MMCYPNTAKIYKNQLTGNTDIPYASFLSRNTEAYEIETIAFCEYVVNSIPVPCTEHDSLVAIITALAADKFANEVLFKEVVVLICCSDPESC